MNFIDELKQLQKLENNIFKQAQKVFILEAKERLLPHFVGTAIRDGYSDEKLEAYNKKIGFEKLRAKQEYKTLAQKGNELFNRYLNNHFFTIEQMKEVFVADVGISDVEFNLFISRVLDSYKEKNSSLHLDKKVQESKYYDLVLKQSDMYKRLSTIKIENDLSSHSYLLQQSNKWLKEPFDLNKKVSDFTKTFSIFNEEIQRKKTVDKILNYEHQIHKEYFLGPINDVIGKNNLNKKNRSVEKLEKEYCLYKEVTKRILEQNNQAMMLSQNSYIDGSVLKKVLEHELVPFEKVSPHIVGELKKVTDLSLEVTQSKVQLKQLVINSINFKEMLEKKLTLEVGNPKVIEISESIKSDIQKIYKKLEIIQAKQSEKPLEIACAYPLKMPSTDYLKYAGSEGTTLKSIVKKADSSSKQHNKKVVFNKPIEININR